MCSRSIPGAAGRSVSMRITRSFSKFNAPFSASFTTFSSAANPMLRALLRSEFRREGNQHVGRVQVVAVDREAPDFAALERGGGRIDERHR